MNLIGQLQDITTLRDWSPLKISLREPLGLGNDDWDWFAVF